MNFCFPIFSVIDDDDAISDIAMAINESEVIEGPSTSNVSDKYSGTLAQYEYPRTLLERILENTRKNQDLETDRLRLKKIHTKLKQKVRLQNATISSETIEIS